MNYKVLYRKYRPDDFSQLIGQNHIVSILKNSIVSDKLAHAYLFSGPRGTGKTSTARIFAKAINCLDNKDGIACGVCDNCKSFSTNPDIIEIDAASNNGVDEIRELINNVKIMPTSLKYKVYIIDEVHMLSQSAFNALLLTLEEPPQHVIFILATTNLENVPITIVSRCQRFDFKKINDDDLFNHLKYVCDSESISYDDDGLKEIALLADGGLRDALSILDQLSKNNESITADLVSKEVGSVSNKKIEDILLALKENDVISISSLLNDFQNSSINYKVVIKKMISVLSDIAVDNLSGKSDTLDFDICKKLVLDLNNIINNININVDAYLLIKMLLFEYVKRPNKEQKVEKKLIEKDFSSETPKTVEKNITNELNNNGDLVDIRINNCFVNASKKYLADIKVKWEDFIKNVSSSSIKGLISDSSCVAASDKYAIIACTIPHKEDEANKEVGKIEKLFNENIKLVFVSENKWNIEKEKYINNIKNKYVYILKEESIINNGDDMSSVADVFDINKIEVE